MIKRILLLLAVLWLSPVHAQSLTKLCFPTGTQGGSRTTCQEVTVANPLPITGINVSVGSLTITGATAVSATITNTTGAPVFVSNPNGFGGNGTVTQGTSPWIVSTPNTLSVLDAQVLAAVQSSVPTGTNTIGSVGSVLLTTGGATTITMSNLLTTPNAIKASAGQLLKVYCYNPNASVAYIQLYNIGSGSVTPGTTKPLQFYGIPATNAAGFAMSPVGDQFSTAISAAVTTTATGGTAPSSGMDCTVSFN